MSMDSKIKRRPPLGKRRARKKKISTQKRRFYGNHTDPGKAGHLKMERKLTK